MTINFQSGEWHQVRKWAEAELEKARIKNDGMLSAEETAALRGEIRALKRLIGLPLAAARDVAVEPGY